MNFFWRWLVLSVAVLVAVHLKFLGIHCDRGWPALLTVSLLLGIVNAFVRPLLVAVTLPVVVLSFGVALLFINALLFYAVGHMVEGFHVDSFASAFGGSLVIGMISFFLGGLRSRTRRTPASPPPSRRRSGPPPGNGPIIDV